jgi:hypothetical protein
MHHAVFADHRSLVLCLTQDPPAAPAPQVRFGQFRHVQLLELRGDVVRFATQVELGTMGVHRPAGQDTCIAVFEGSAREPVSELALGGSLIRGFTWTERTAWRLLELGGASWLAVLEHRRQEPGGLLRVLTFPGGEEVLRVADVQEIEDALVRGGQADLVVRRGKFVRWLRLSEAGEVVLDASIDLGLEHVGCAALARGAGGSGGWGVGWRGGKLLAVPFDERGAHPERSVPVEFEGGPDDDRARVGARLRAAAWTSESGTHLVVSWPGYRNAVGKLQVLDVGSKPRRLWEGRPGPEVDGDSLDQNEYGQALAFVPDADGDGVPEVLVTGPWNFVTRVDLLSGRTGSPLERWSPGGFLSTGHSLSLSADGTRALVGGAAQRGYPENLVV